MSAGRVTTTPWSRGQCKRLGIDTSAIAQTLPDGVSLMLSGRSAYGPWYVRLYVDGREMSPMDDYGAVPTYRDLAHAIPFVLSHLEGVPDGR